MLRPRFVLALFLSLLFTVTPTVTSGSLFAVGPCCESPYIRGDVNNDGMLSLGDAVQIVHVIFGGNGFPAGAIECAYDANANGSLNLVDVLDVVTHIFLAEPALLPAPYPDPGVDAACVAAPVELVLHSERSIFEVGDAVPLTLVAHYSDGTELQVGDEATWELTDDSVVDVVEGFAPELCGEARGSTVVTATFSGIRSNPLNIAVGSAIDNDRILAEITVSSGPSAMAPYRVFVDALATTVDDATIDGTGDSLDYRDLKFLWDFGVAGAEHNIQVGGNLCGSFAYELADGADDTPITIALAVIDPDGGEIGIATHSFTLEPYSGTTYYFAESGNDSTGDGSLDAPWQTFAKAADEVRDRDGAIRCLFQRGDTFEIEAEEEFFDEVGDPLILFGAYGEGDRPLFTADTVDNQSLIELNGSCHHWAFVDLDFDKPGHPLTDPDSVGEIWDINGSEANQTGPQNILILRCRADGGGTTLSTYRDVFDEETLEHQIQDISIFDSDFRNTTSMILFLGGERMAVIGNTLKANGNEHLLRLWYLGRAAILRNHCEDVSMDQSQGPVRTTMRILSTPRREIPNIRPTRHVIVQDNFFQMGANNQCFDIASGHDDIDTDGHTQHIIFERNRLFPSIAAPVSGQSYWDLVADNITIRNNLIHGAAVEDNMYVVRCVDYFDSSNGVIDAPKPHNIWVYGNTVYAPNIAGSRMLMVYVVERDGGTGFAASDADPTGTLIVRNNVLVGGPDGSGGLIEVRSDVNDMVEDGQVFADHNLYYNPDSNSPWILNSAPLGDFTLSEWQDEGQGSGSGTLDAELVAPELGTQRLTVSSSAGFSVGDRVYGLTSGASGIVESTGLNRIDVRAIWSGRPFPGSESALLDTGIDTNLYNLDGTATTDVLAATVVTTREDFRLSPGSPAVGAGVAEPRLFDDFFGRPRPGTQGVSGSPSMGAIEP